MASSADPGHRAQRRRLLKGLAAGVLLPALPAIAAAPARGWPAWEVLAASSLSDDGRMIDRSQADQRSTSEGQSYALFFALVDNDQPRFDRILQWTQDNLAGGDLSARLPAWLWGRDRDSGRWGVLDGNPAADSDLWLAYSLGEGARLWRRPALQEIADGMLARIRDHEVVRLPGLGAMLLPGPQGFVEHDHWRLNPSYLPLPLLRRFAALERKGPWTEIAANTVRMLRETAPHGFAPDWTAWREGGFFVDPARGATGSYDAIRVYLWAGMTDPRDPAFKATLAALGGPLARLRRQQAMAETVDTRSGDARGRGPYGFDAALLPYLQAQGEIALATQQRAALPTPQQQRDDAPAYYSQMLTLFGTGWFDGRYRFHADGRLLPAWRR